MATFGVGRLVDFVRAGGADSVVLVFNGSFNPLHNGHIALALHTIDIVNRSERAKAGGASARPLSVVAAVLSPSSDAYVRGKLGNDAISLSDRVEHCKAACACDPRLFVAAHGEMQGTVAARYVERDIRAAAEAAGAPLTTAFFAIPVFGSDYLVRIPHCLGKPTFIVARNDDERSAEGAREVTAAAHARGSAHYMSRFVFDEASAESGGPLWFDSIPELSSTRIRRSLKAVEACARGAAGAGGEARAAAEFLLNAMPEPVLDFMLSASGGVALVRKIAAS